MNHELKIWPQFYQAVVDGKKTFEVRENDRGFQAGDTVSLMEFDPKIVEKQDGHTGHFYKEVMGYIYSEKLHFTIGYVLPIDDKRVVFSLIKEVENE